MKNSVSIQTFVFNHDYDNVINLWENAGEGIQLRPSDEPEQILKKIQRDPELFLVAKCDDKIIGAVLGGFDGRRGIMYHLAVDKKFRGQGIASSLVDELEKRLKEKGCIRYYLLVVPENANAISFYENRGWEIMNLSVFGKNLD
ncbi:MAG: GNAT family acetyltransferase [Bacteroidales bacterium]|nr:GNAT family acetyltransferase [Bacteroidales bacterium]